MNLDEVILEKIKKCRIYGINNPKVIRNIIKIPDYINIKKLDKIIDSFYDNFYILKGSAKPKLTVSQLHEKYLSIEKSNSIRLSSVPINANKSDYRRISVVNKDWLKESQKKLNKILVKTLLYRESDKSPLKSVVPYLHSSIKKRSFNTNAKAHIGNKYVLALDLKDFYPSVSKMKIYSFFKNEMNLSPDAAMIYTVISTVKNEKGEYCLGQGLPQSTTLAFLTNYHLFNYIYYYALELRIKMSVYVDDIIFSSENEIPQEFINRLFGLIKKNKMLIKREKVHRYNNISTKKLTGVYIKGNCATVPYFKYNEIYIQYSELKKNILKIRNFDEYFEVYNLYLKFYGNYQFIYEVEKRIKKIYRQFVEEYDSYFPKGIHKKDKSLNYKKNNIKNITDMYKLNSCYQRLLNKTISI